MPCTAAASSGETRYRFTPQRQARPELGGDLERILVEGDAVAQQERALVLGELPDQDGIRIDAGGLEVDDLGAEWPAFVHPKRPEFLLTLPHVHGTSGFFIARLRSPS